MKSELVINKDKSNELKLNGIILLRLLDDAVKELIKTHRNNESIKTIQSVMVNNQKQYLFDNGLSWVLAVAQLSNFICGNDIQRIGDNAWFPCEIKITANGQPVEVCKNKDNEDAFIKFPAGNDYQSITNHLIKICEAKSISHAKLADTLLSRLQGNQYPSEFKFSSAEENFFDSLLVLMFGVEVSRNNATLLTGLMLLDLIKAQQNFGTRVTRTFSWHNAFVSEHGYKWDDWEYQYYGGKFPMSQTSTDRGNLGGKAPDVYGKFFRVEHKDIVDKYQEYSEKGDSENLNELIENNKPIIEKLFFAVDLNVGRENFICHENKSSENDNKILKVLVQSNQRHAVPRRELSLIVHWLESLADKSMLEKVNDEKELKEQILKLFKSRLAAGFNLSLKIEEKANHDIKANKESTVSKRERESTINEAVLEKFTTKLSLIKYKDGKSKLIALRRGVAFNRETKQPSYGVSVMTYHASNKCKLIPDYIHLSIDKEICTKGIKNYVEGSLKDISKAAKNNINLYKDDPNSFCKYCATFFSPHVDDFASPAKKARHTYTISTPSKTDKENEILADAVQSKADSSYQPQ